MAILYNNLWKMIIDKKVNKSELCKTLKISNSTMAKMTNEEMVAMSVLEQICAELDCNIGDIVEFTKLDEVKAKIHENFQREIYVQIKEDELKETGLKGSYYD